MNTDSNHPRHSKDSPAFVPLPGSDRGPEPGPAATPGLRAPAPDDQEIEISIYLRRRQPVPEQHLPGGPPDGDPGTGHGADPADIELATRTLSALGARIIHADPQTRCLRVGGTTGTLAAVFGTRLEILQGKAPAPRRHRTGGLSVPAELDGIITAVLGLDNRPAARPRFHFSPAATQSASYTPLDLARIYDFPAGTDGNGSVIAIIELGGGYGMADLQVYFSSLGILVPKVTSIGVDGASNVPGADPQGADGEVLLDIEVAGALAPKAEIKVYFAPNTDAGFINAVARAAHDSPAPAAISISWGQAEDQWTEQARTQMDEAFIDATLLGATVTAAAGDNGSADDVPDGRNHADFPASSPHALACGGTSLLADPRTGKVSSETVWNDSTHSATGGGVSGAFDVPAWQGHLSVATGTAPAAALDGRGIPDVAAVADPRTGYRVRIDGSDMVIGGTSAVAPLWAALLARLAGASGHGGGLLQPALYAAAPAGTTGAGFRDVIAGNNGTYLATAGWDACTGLGVPIGTALAARFRGSVAAISAPGQDAP